MDEQRTTREQERLANEQARLRAVVEAFHREQEEQQAVDNATKEALRPPPQSVDADTRERLRRKNELMAQRTQELKRAQEEKMTAREKKQNELLAHASASHRPVDRDPSRLTQPTEALRRRAEMREKDPDAPQQPGTVRAAWATRVLATPSWRQGI